MPTPRNRNPVTLNQWLSFIQACHPRSIELGLERVAAVYEALGSPRPAPTVIVVGGTNGKGSCVAILESLLRVAGQRVGCYTSPHLLRFNERLRVDGADSSNEQWLKAFARVEQARAGKPLTYFEFSTLAALLMLNESGAEVALLEVGLGGRLDAVNVVSADAALVSTVDLDHMDWLGEDRETIGWEKAGIYHPGKIAVCAERDAPSSLSRRAAEIGARYYQAGDHFDAAGSGEGWTWRGLGRSIEGLPPVGIAGSFQKNNAAACLALLEALGFLERISVDQIKRGVREAHVAGRLQTVRESPEIVVDVGHNPAAARAIAGWLRENPVGGASRVVLGMLKTKDVAGFSEPLAPLFDRWYLASLDVKQGLSAEELASRLSARARLQGCFEGVEEAVAAAIRDSSPADRILILGSFHTAAAGLLAARTGHDR